MRPHLQKYKTIYVIVLVLLLTSIVLYYYPPDTIVDYIGVENSYLAVFLIAATGGLSSFTSGVFYAAVGTFSAGGAVPWLLGITGGLGIAIGDSIIFWLAQKGSSSIKGPDSATINKIEAWATRWPRSIQYGFIFLYLAFSPFPNDILMVALAVLGYTYRNIVLLIIAGGISITTITAYLGTNWNSFIFW